MKRPIGAPGPIEPPTPTRLGAPAKKERGEGQVRHPQRAHKSAKKEFPFSVIWEDGDVLEVEWLKNGIPVVVVQRSESKNRKNEKSGEK